MRSRNPKSELKGTQTSYGNNDNNNSNSPGLEMTYLPASSSLKDLPDQRSPNNDLLTNLAEHVNEFLFT